MRSVLLPAAALLSVASPCSAAAQGAPLDGFEAWVEAARQAWTTPGLSVAIVAGDAVVFARGFGLRELGGDAAVDSDTLFAD